MSGGLRSQRQGIKLTRLRRELQVCRNSWTRMILLGDSDLVMLHFHHHCHHHHHHQWHLNMTEDDPPRWFTVSSDLLMLFSFVRDVKNVCSACRDSSKETGENLRWIKIWLFRLCLSCCAAAGQLRTRGTFKPQSCGQGWSYHCWRCQLNHNIYQYLSILSNSYQYLQNILSSS